MVGGYLPAPICDLSSIRKLGFGCPPIRVRVHAGTESVRVHNFLQPRILLHSTCVLTTVAFLPVLTDLSALMRCGG
jgi:hypothetical protein